MNRKKMIMAVCICAAAMLVLSGCKPSKKKVVNSSYYKALEEEKKDLEKENKKLKSQVEASNNASSDAQRAQSYLNKIARDSLVKLEIGYMEDMQSSEFLDEKAAFSFVTELARRADRTTKYSPNEVEKRFSPGYEYVLYDENNAVYEMMVFQGDYVVFPDLPEYVFYAKGASALGDAFLHYRQGYPDSKLLHRLADCPLATDKKGHYYENTIIAKMANTIDRMDKEKTSRDKAVGYWKKNNKAKMEKEGTVYTFFHHGNTLTATFYDRYIRIENMDGNATWYQASEEDVDSALQLLKDDWNSRKDDVNKKQDSSDKFHYNEMQSESGNESDTDDVSDQ